MSDGKTMLRLRTVNKISEIQMAGLDPECIFVSRSDWQQYLREESELYLCKTRPSTKREFLGLPVYEVLDSNVLVVAPKIPE